MEILYSKGDIKFYEDGEIYLTDGKDTYTITSSPQEPCLYVTGPTGRTIIHNSFEASWIENIARKGGTLRSLSGKVYDIGGLCRLLLLAAREYSDTDISKVEALAPEVAIPPKGDSPFKKIRKSLRRFWRAVLGIG